MRIILSILTLALCSVSWAQTGVVEKSKNGKSIVDFFGETIRPGTTVAVGAAAGGLQKRDHSINGSFLYSSLNQKVGSNSSSVSAMNVDVLYLRNFGDWEIGGGPELTQIEGSSSTTLHGQGRWNFTPNKPGNDFIPFVGGGLTLLTGDVSGNGFYAMGGITWLPFSQIFGLDGILTYSTSEQKNNGGTKLTTSGFSLSLGWRVLF